MGRLPSRIWFVFLCILALSVDELSAVILLRTDDPAANTTAPDGPLQASGWQWQGIWGAFLGTPIHSHIFVTARHVGGALGDAMILNGVRHGTIAYRDHPQVDLRLWCVCDPFPDFAPLSTRTNEIGLPMVIYGRGTQRGEPVIQGDELKGWRWGASDGRVRWGENQVSAWADGSGNPTSDPADPEAVLLQATFDANAGPNEAHASTGDSGGAVFIQEQGTWWLAGILYGVDGPYDLSSSGDGFQAALFDVGGLYQWMETEWFLHPESDASQPGAFYATRIAPQVEWLRAAIADLALAPIRPHLESAADLAGPFIDVPDVGWDPSQRTFQIPLPGKVQFYRVRGCTPWRIARIETRSRFLALQVQAGTGI